VDLLQRIYDEIVAYGVDNVVKEIDLTRHLAGRLGGEAEKGRVDITVDGKTIELKLAQPYMSKSRYTEGVLSLFKKHMFDLNGHNSALHDLVHKRPDYFVLLLYYHDGHPLPTGSVERLMDEAPDYEGHEFEILDNPDLLQVNGKMRMVGFERRP